MVGPLGDELGKLLRKLHRFDHAELDAQKSRTSPAMKY